MAARVAVFLGAGASKAFEFPLTGELLPEIRRRLLGRNLFGRGKQAEKDERFLMKCLTSILPGFRLVADEELPLITEILSVIDYSLVADAAIVPAIPRTRLRRARRLLELAIYEALDWEVDYDQDPPALLAMVDWLEGVMKKSESVTVLSTNYDPVIDLWLFDRLKARRVRETIDFGFEWRDVDLNGRLHARPAKPALSIYRLHGALNWLRCPLCERIYINLDGAIFHQGFQPLDEDTGANRCHCHYGPLEPVMVAPSSVRDIRDNNLLEIWKHAIEALRLADHWILIGYSFPPEDTAIRSVLIRAYNARSPRSDGVGGGGMRPPAITVIQKGFDRATVARYKAMFPNCRYSTEGMEPFCDALPDWRRYCQSLPKVRSLRAPATPVAAGAKDAVP